MSVRGSRAEMPRASGREAELNTVADAGRQARILIVSHVHPFDPKSGQQQRVKYTLQALRDHFDLAFLTYAPASEIAETERRLSGYGIKPIVMPSRRMASPVASVRHRAAATLFNAYTGLKRSNYYIGQLELAPDRIAEAVPEQGVYDAVLFEYWHAAASTAVFRRQGVPCILDMHNILWQSYEAQMAQAGGPAWWKQRAIRRYRASEEQGWAQFDALIAINEAERDYVQAHVPPEVAIFYAPMGTDLSRWPYGWQPAHPPRLAYYGGLGRPENEQGALACYEQIMPRIWERVPGAELWLVGNNPTGALRALETDPRVHVTGYVEEVQTVLREMTAVLCPWHGTFGFRSRLIEVMALGVPVVATPDAVYGMGLRTEHGLLLADDYPALAVQALRLLTDTDLLYAQSEHARKEVERCFSLDQTYGALARRLHAWLLERKRTPQAVSC